jgi:hypothetical protein
MNIHLRHPKLGYHACGLGDPASVIMTEDLDNVTCQRCLQSVTAKKRLPGRPPTGKAKTSITVRLPPELLTWIDSQSGDRTQVIIEALMEKKKQAVSDSSPAARKIHSSRKQKHERHCN